jgi:protocatechuate 3,4-dioxygenase beta subunit
MASPALVIATAASQATAAPTVALAVTVAPTEAATARPATSEPPSTPSAAAMAAPAQATTVPVTVATATLAVSAAGASIAGAAESAVTPAPACLVGPGALTPALTEGPYYKAGPPENSALAQSGVPGPKLTLTGYVFDANCKPIPGARVDFWQADGQGQYDNNGYTLRGYQVTDAQGRYSVETVVPGIYPGRTRHIHVKVTPPNGTTLTTQLFFPNEPLNSSDSIFAAQNVVTTSQGADGEVATFNFEVNAR